MTSCLASSLPPSLAVGVSGGADSMALVVLAQHWAKSQNITLTALTVDHGLRKGSNAEAVQVQGWLFDLGIDHQILTWSDKGAVTTAVQARARDARYRLMGDWCQEQGVSSLLVAHHLDDQAETVLMRLKKSSTLYGLGAMALRRDMDGVALCRPLLPVPKSRLISTLKAKGQGWIEDPSNQNTAFERVRVRAQLVHLAKDGVTTKRLAGVANSVRAVCDVLDVAAERLLQETVFSSQKGETVLNTDFFKAPSQVCSRALSKLLCALGKTAYPPSPNKLLRLLTWMEKAQEGARTLCGVLVRMSPEGFYLSRELPRKQCKTK